MVVHPPPPKKTDPQMSENSFEFLFRKEGENVFCAGKLIRDSQLRKLNLTYLDWN
jgi:hypothetical protein